MLITVAALATRAGGTWLIPGRYSQICGPHLNYASGAQRALPRKGWGATASQVDPPLDRRHCPLMTPLSVDIWCRMQLGVENWVTLR